MSRLVLKHQTRQLERSLERNHLCEQCLRWLASSLQHVASCALQCYFRANALARQSTRHLMGSPGPLPPAGQQVESHRNRECRTGHMLNTSHSSLCERNTYQHTHTYTYTYTRHEHYITLYTTTQTNTHFSMDIGRS